MDSIVYYINDVFFYTITSFSIALVSFVYSVVLTEPGMILNKFYLYLERKLPVLLFKPLIGCGKCVTGQVSIFYSIYYLFEYEENINIFVIISLSIFVFIIIDKLYTWLTN